MDAGTSADRNYRRQVRRHRTRLIATFPVRLAGAGLAGIAAHLGVQAAGFPSLYGIPGVVVAIVVLKLLLPSWTPTGAGAWQAGAIGERWTQQILEQLDDRWVLLHDRSMPGGKGNIDHLVVGPRGVAVVDSKRYRGPFRIRRGWWILPARWTAAGVDRRSDLAGLGRQATAISTALADAQLPHHVRQVICLHSKQGPAKPRRAGNVTISPPGHLPRVLRHGRRLTRRQVDQVAVLLDEAFPTA